jgi:hypothetical protein
MTKDTRDTSLASIRNLKIFWDSPTTTTVCFAAYHHVVETPTFTCSNKAIRVHKAVVCSQA